MKVQVWIKDRNSAERRFRILIFKAPPPEGIESWIKRQNKRNSHWWHIEEWRIMEAYDDEAEGTAPRKEQPLGRCA